MAVCIKAIHHKVPIIMKRKYVAIIMKRKYVAVIEAFAVRDVQFCNGSDTDPSGDFWEDLSGAEVFVGIYFGEYDKVLQEAADEIGTDPNNIRLIDVDSDA